MDLGYYWWKVRWLYPHQIKYWFTEKLPWKIALLLPPKVAFFAFIRVYGIRGDCTKEYITTCNMWEEKYGINRNN